MSDNNSDNWAVVCCFLAVTLLLSNIAWAIAVYYVVKAVAA